jgi:hypothetical protein
MAIDEPTLRKMYPTMFHPVAHRGQGVAGGDRLAAMQTVREFTAAVARSDSWSDEDWELIGSAGGR